MEAPLALSAAVLVLTASAGCAFKWRRLLGKGPRQDPEQAGRLLHPAQLTHHHPSPPSLHGTWTCSVICSVVGNAHTGQLLDGECLAALQRHGIAVHEVLGQGMFGKVFKGAQEGIGCPVSQTGVASTFLTHRCGLAQAHLRMELCL